MNYRHEQVKPYNDKEEKSKQVAEMFDNIAPGYDLLNHLLSFNIDKIWRKRAISSLKEYAPKEILDVATGTGDFALLAHKMLAPQRIVGCDISDGMMEIARQKCRDKNIENITFEHEDCTALTYHDASFDAATLAFGMRNFDNLEKGLAELLRILRSGGHLIALEFSSPLNFPMKQLFPIYSRYIMPFIGRMVSKDSSAYRYLPESIAAFPQGEQMKEILLRTGFSKVEFHRFTGGICTLYIAQK